MHPLHRARRQHLAAVAGQQASAAEPILVSRAVIGFKKEGGGDDPAHVQMHALPAHVRDRERAGRSPEEAQGAAPGGPSSLSGWAAGASLVVFLARPRPCAAVQLVLHAHALLP